MLPGPRPLLRSAILGAVLSCCDGQSEDRRPVFGELPYPLPTEGSLSQSVAMQRSSRAGSGFLLEEGCITFAHVRCEATGAIRDTTFWRYCLEEGEWRELPDDAYVLRGTLCDFDATIDQRPAIVRCIDGRCDEDGTCWVLSTFRNEQFTEEHACATHENGSAAGAACDFGGC